jgi:hypothetical protein
VCGGGVVENVECVKRNNKPKISDF